MVSKRKKPTVYKELARAQAEVDAADPSPARRMYREFDGTPAHALAIARAMFEDPHCGDVDESVTYNFAMLLADDARQGGGTRAATFDGETFDVPVRSRASIAEAREPGPLLVDEYDTTVVVRPGWTVRRDAATQTLVLERL